MPVIVEVLLATVITIALVLASPYTMFAALMLAAIPGAYVAAKRGWLWSAVVILAGTVVAYILDPLYGVIYFAQAPLILTLGLCLGKKAAAFKTFAFSAAAAVAGIAIVVLAVKISSGKDVITYAMDAYKTIIAENDAMASLMYMSVNTPAMSMTEMMGSEQKMAEFMAEMEKIAAMPVSEMREILLSAPQLTLMRTSITNVVPTIFSGAMFGAIISTVLVRLMVKRAGTDVAVLPSFDRFIVPKKISPYLVITYIIIYIPILFDMEKLVFAASILSALLSPILVVQGISLVYYLFKRITRKRWLAVLLTVVAGALMINICLYIGLFEQVVRVREKRFNREA